MFCGQGCNGLYMRFRVEWAERDPGVTCPHSLHSTCGPRTVRSCSWGWRTWEWRGTRCPLLACRLGASLAHHRPPVGRRRQAGGQGRGGTYGDAVAEAGARLRAGGAYVIPHCGVLAGRAVEVGDGSWAVGPREASGPRRVGACRGSGPAKIRLSTVAIQDWCAENRAGYEAGSQACTGHHKPDTREEQLRPDF